MVSIEHGMEALENRVGDLVNQITQPEALDLLTYIEDCKVPIEQLLWAKLYGPLRRYVRPLDR